MVYTTLQIGEVSFVKEVTAIMNSVLAEGQPVSGDDANEALRNTTVAPFSKAMLKAKLIERLKPLVEAEEPDNTSDLAVQAFESSIKGEIEELKVEAFGSEVSFPKLVVSGRLFM